jgi:hypothetical protein
LPHANVTASRRFTARARCRRENSLSLRKPGATGYRIRRAGGSRFSIFGNLPAGSRALNASATIGAHRRRHRSSTDGPRMSYKLAETAATILKTLKGGDRAGTRDGSNDRHDRSAEPHRDFPLAPERSDERDTARPDATSSGVEVESEIAALISQAGDRLRQQLDDVQRDRDSAQSPGRLPPDPRERRPWWWRFPR